MENFSLYQAIRLAVEAHGMQLDKAEKLYILHPFRVMSQFPTTAITHQIVAVLHDVVEDTDVKLEDIRYTFGDIVADAIDALSRREGETYTDFIERAAKNLIARAVKLADIQDNLLRSESVAQHESLRKRYIKANNRLVDVIMWVGDPDEIVFISKLGLLDIK